MAAGIYRIQIGERFYYGQSQDLEKREKEHLARLRRGVHENQRVQNTYNKYQEFHFEVVATVVGSLEPDDLTVHLNALEQLYLDKFHDTEGCMNIAKCAEVSRRGAKHLEATKAKLRKANLGKVLSAEHRRKISEGQKGRVSGMRGKTHSLETKMKMSLSLRGRRHSEEAKRKISIAQVGQGCRPCYGRPLGTNEWVYFDSRQSAANHINGQGTKINYVIQGKWKQHKGWEFIELP